jgi:AcrR family transcriptional regulator
MLSPSVARDTLAIAVVDHVSDESAPSLNLLEPKVFSEHKLRLVRGTYNVMTRVGAQGLSLRGVAKDLGVSPALLIYHFGSKDNLLIETMHWALAGSLRRVLRRIARATDPREALAASLDGVFVDARANRDFYLVYLDLVQYSVRHESFTVLAALLRQHIDDAYAAVIRQGVDAGVFDVANVDQAARQVRALVEGAFLQWLQTEDWEETHAALRHESYQGVLRLLAPGP